MPTIRRLAYSAVSMVSPPPEPPVAPGSTTLNVGATNCRLLGGWVAVQSRIPTANAPICSSCARSWLSAPTVSTRKSRPPSAPRVISTAPASDPSRTSAAAAAASSWRSKSKRRLAAAPESSRALRKPSMTDTARSPSVCSSATTAIRVTVTWSTNRTASGMSAIITARPASSTVENTNARARTRSAYSRRATSPMLPSAMLPRPTSRRASPPASCSTRGSCSPRGACSSLMPHPPRQTRATPGRRARDGARPPADGRHGR